jgi:ribulose-5-phosphate 4-epimerase/fuculose-1-phosphate aldolase
VSTVTQVSLREQLVSLSREMFRLGLVTGTSGNMSVRGEAGDTCLVTPSGVDYEHMTENDVVEVDLDGSPRPGQLKPSVDTMNHCAIYRARTDVSSVIHTHSPYAAAFSTLHRVIPALVAEAAGYLGGEVRVAPYLPPARPELGERAAEAIGADRAVLLPNHGVIAVGETASKAFHAAVSVEELARVAHLALLLGEPVPVPAGEVDRIYQFIHFKYGQR